MTTLLTSAQKNLYTSLNVHVSIEGAEQLVLDTFNYHAQYNNGITYTRLDPIKVVLTGIRYEMNDGELVVDFIEAVGFRKDKRIRAKSNHYYRHNPQYKDMITQIPDSYHDLGRRSLDEMLETLIKDLTTTKQKGLQL